MATSGSWEVSWQSTYWDQTYNTKYYHWAGSWSKSGNTITLSNMTLWMTFTYVSGGYGVTDVVTVTGGSAQTVYYPNFSNTYSTARVSLNNTSFSVGTSDTSANIYCVISGENTGSATVYFDASVVAPATPTVSVSEIYPTGAKFNVSISSYGNPSGASGRYIEAAILNQSSYGNTYKYNVAFNTSSSAITVTNATAYGGTLNIQPNTRYYYGGYASNTQAAESTVTGQFVTKAMAANITPDTITSDSATFTYATGADGGYYNKTVEYSIDGGATWTNVATITGGSASSGTFTISGLTAGTRYSLQTRTTTTSGTTIGSTIPFVVRTGLVSAFYGSANSQSVKTIDLYGSVDGQTKIMSKLYGEENDQTKLIHQGFGHVDYGYGYIVYYTDNNNTTTNIVKISSQSELNTLKGPSPYTESSAWSVNIGGVNIFNDKIKEVVLTKIATTIPARFLMNCVNLESLDLSNSALASAGGSFLYGMGKLTLLKIGSLSPSIFQGSSWDSTYISTYDNTAITYTSGVKIAGQNRSAWLTRFPNSQVSQGSTTYYRKTVDAGY